MPISSQPQRFGAGLIAIDSTDLAALDPSGLTIGTRCFNVDVVADFTLTTSTAALVADEVVAVSGTTGARWIKFVVADADHANTADLATLATTADAIPQVDVSVTDHIGIPKRLYWTGDTDTYIEVVSANRIDFYAGGALLCTLNANGFSMNSGAGAGHLFLGGGIEVQNNNAGSLALIPGNRQVQIGAAGALAHDAVGGFPTIPTVAGTPDGTPANLASGHAPFIIDTSADKLWAYYGGAWHDLTGT